MITNAQTNHYLDFQIENNSESLTSDLGIENRSDTYIKTKQIGSKPYIKNQNYTTPGTNTYEEASYKDRISSQSSNNHIVGAYLPHYRINSVSSDALDHLTHLFYFSFGPNEQGELGRVDQQGNFTHIENISSVTSDINTLKKWKLNKNTKLFVTVGGWIQSDYLDEVAANKSARNNLAQKIKEFCLLHELDGVDIDWEGYNGAVDGKNYGLLLSAIISALADTDIGISVTIAPQHTGFTDQLKQVDFIQLMMYGKRIGEGTQFPTSIVKNLTNNWINKGIEKSKIVIGIPAYAQTDIDQDFSAITYRYIMETYNPDINVDSVVDNNKTYYFNSVSTIKEKAQYVKNQNLLGIMMWELGQDLSVSDSKSLLKAITDVIPIDNEVLGTITNYLETAKSTIYPNPINNKVIVTLPASSSSNVIADIIDYRGSIVWSHKKLQLRNKKVEININNLQVGTYLLRILDKGNVYTTKFLKN